jgi:DNA-binding XRE family transcriptional regulator
MGKLEGIIKSEIVRLAKREIRKISVPMGKKVRSLKDAVSRLRQTVLALERFTAQQQKELGRGRIQLEATQEEVKKSRFSPRLVRSLRKRLGITQKEMATLIGVTIGAIYQWEKGIFEPRGEKKGMFVALRKLGRREVRRLLEKSGPEMTGKKVRKPKGRRTKRRSRK